MDFKDAKEITREDLENYYIMRREKCSPFTIQAEFLDIKLFYRWLLPEKEEDNLRGGVF